MKSRLLVAAVGVPLILWVVLWAPIHVLGSGGAVRRRGL